MSFASLLHAILIYPIQQIIEVFYIVFRLTFKSEGIAVVGVSFVFTLLCLPLYMLAETYQEKERKLQESMKCAIQRIKKTFRGDERFMILQTYYKERGYHPLMALRSSFGIMLQIPFFLAAYSFLAHLDSLQGTPFLFIKDMGKPDGIISLWGFNINLLPAAMTAINIVSGAVYTKGHPFREKAQILISAGVFLILLYNMPSGLVLYWTMNNIFSLVKNVCLKIPPKVLHVCLYIASMILYALLIWYLYMRHGPRVSNRHTLTLILCWIPFTPLLLKAARRFFRGFTLFERDRKSCAAIFVQSVFMMWLLVGIVIPSMVISSSASEFCFIDSYNSPFPFVLNCMAQAAGAVLFYPVCIFFLVGCSKKAAHIQAAFAFLSEFACYAALANCFLFFGYHGNISAELKLDTVNAGTLAKVFNAAFLVILAVSAKYFFKSKYALRSKTVKYVIILALSLTGVFNCVKIGAVYRRAEKPVFARAETIEPIYTLSKTSPNVIVFLLDQFTSSLFPEMVKEDPSLASEYSGFVYYPNTISYGLHTVVGAPALMGGYSYRPQNINERSNEKLALKIDEAIETLPHIFSNNGFDIVLADIDRIAGSDMFKTTIDGAKTVKVSKTYRNMFYLENSANVPHTRSKILLRDFIWFSAFRSCPVFLRRIVYKYDYWSVKEYDSIDTFVDDYSPLFYLEKLTNFSSGGKPTFTFIYSALPHDPMFLDAPDYTIPKDPDNFSMSDSKFKGLPNYYSAMATIRLLSAFMTYLKENGCYDNTRIIMAADHGVLIRTGTFKDNVIQIEGCNPLLMVKDFAQNEPLKTDMSFMTQCDVPYIATKGIIQNPTDSLGNVLSMAEKNETQYLFMNHNNTIEKHNANTYKQRSLDWYSVHDDIFNETNWDNTPPLLHSIKQTTIYSGFSPFFIDF